MTEPQKEYIITEKLLSEIETYARGSWVNTVRSRPYKSSYKVLEQCETFDIIRFLKIRYGEEEAIMDALENVEDEVLAELRTKERERMRKEMTR